MDSPSKLLKVIREHGITKTFLAISCILAISFVTFFVVGSFFDLAFARASSKCYEVLPHLPACGDIIDMPGALLSSFLSLVAGIVFVKKLFTQSFTALTLILFAVILAGIVGNQILKNLYVKHEGVKA